MTCWFEIDEIDNENFELPSQVVEYNKLALSIYLKNNLNFLPKNLNRVFPNLVVILATFNSVISVGIKPLKSLSKLKLLDLGSNKIEHIAGDAFIDLVSLEDLSLHSNRIHYVGKNTFSSLKALKKLSMSDNEIQFLPAMIFDSLKNLEELNLGTNEITSLDENIFKSLTKLKKIHLENNKLSKIPNHVFDHEPNLEYVNLAMNTCIDELYNAPNSFNKMKSDLRQKCNDNTLPDNIEALGKRVYAVEKTAQCVAKSIRFLDEC